MRMYTYTRSPSAPPLQAFSVVFQKAIERAEPSEVVKERAEKLIDSITYSVFMYTSRGLFERDKLIFTSQVAFQVPLPLSLSPSLSFTHRLVLRCCSLPS